MEDLVEVLEGVAGRCCTIIKKKLPKEGGVPLSPGTPREMPNPEPCEIAAREMGPDQGKADVPASSGSTCVPDQRERKAAGRGNTVIKKWDGEKQRTGRKGWSIKEGRTIASDKGALTTTCKGRTDACAGVAGKPGGLEKDKD